MHKTEYALQLTTQALKDILNAAHNEQPYTWQELEKYFTKDYEAGYEALNEAGIGEIA